MIRVKWNKNSLSRLCLGTVQLGLDYGISNKTGQVSLLESYKILDFVTFSGINCFDTAKSYGNSEEVLIKYFKKRKLNDKLIISKINSELFKLQKEFFLYEVQKSLINNEKLFAILLHDNKILFSWNKENTEYINFLKEKNIISYFGASIYTNEEFQEALNNKNIDIIQIPFNIFDQRAIKLEWFKKAKDNNKLIFVRSVFLQGLLLMDEESIPKHLKKAKKHIENLEKICEKLCIRRNELCLLFVKSMAKDSVIIFGCDDLNQAKENVRIFNNINEINNDFLEIIKKEFSDIDELIYNPSKW